MSSESVMAPPAVFCGQRWGMVTPSKLGWKGVVGRWVAGGSRREGVSQWRPHPNRMDAGYPTARKPLGDPPHLEGRKFFIHSKLSWNRPARGTEFLG